MLAYRILNPYVSAQQEVWEFYSRFALAAQGEVVRIRIQNRRARGRSSVKLTDNTRIITVDKNPAYPRATAEMKRGRELWRFTRSHPDRRPPPVIAL